MLFSPFHADYCLKRLSLACYTCLYPRPTVHLLVDQSSELSALLIINGANYSCQTKVSACESEKFYKGNITAWANRATGGDSHIAGSITTYSYCCKGDVITYIHTGSTEMDEDIACWLLFSTLLQSLYRRTCNTRIYNIYDYNAIAAWIQRSMFI